MRYLSLICLVVAFPSLCNGQTLRPARVTVQFDVNGTATKLIVPPGFDVITDPEVLKDLPYPENQNLYLALTPYSGDVSRHVAVGSRPELDSQDITAATFAKMGKSFDTEFSTDKIQQRVERFASLVDEWRSRKGLPGFDSAKTLAAKSVGNARVITAVVSNEDGSDFVNSVVMRHHKNRIVVIAASSRLTGKDDIAWSVATAEKFRNSLE